jgi:UTP--glucose-1-phosphate uridylyltransferase
MCATIGQVPFHGVRFEGRRFDCGDKVGFIEANLAFALARPEMKERLGRSIRTMAAEADVSAENEKVPE